VALLGVLSRFLELPESSWIDAIREALPPHLHDVNLQAFSIGRNA
jgi:Pyruvate/2-oxoacid:ferredoxin oxidoreductase gamma subunit